MKTLEKRMKTIEKLKAKTKARSQKPSLQTKQNKKMKTQIKLQ